MKGQITIGKRHQELSNLKDEVNFYLAEACLYLGIPEPSINFLFFNSPADFDAGYDPYKRKILLSLFTEDQPIRDCVRLNYGLNSNRDLILFTLFHEVGHHWHNVEHQGHWAKFEPKFKARDTVGLTEYMEQPLERIAEAVGRILFKELLVKRKQGKDGRSKLLSHRTMLPVRR